VSKQPLYPHIPKGRVIKTYPSFDKKGYPLVSKPVEKGLRFLPDSAEVLAQTMEATGYRDKLASVFQEAIARVKGQR